MTAPAECQRMSDLQVGNSLPERDFDCDIVQQMLYNAVLWNGHRIHYDHAYATQIEDYPGMVVAGPLLGDWLHQCVDEWLGSEGRILSIDYSNRVASYIGETLTSGGTVTELHPDRNEAVIEVFVKNADGTVVTPGKVKVRFGDSW